MKNAYLVFGPESSGTSMLTEYLIKCSGAFGDWGHEQSLDREKTWEQIKPDVSIVWRRSLPHGGSWPDIEGMITKVKGRGFFVYPIGIIRSELATVRSQRRCNHVKTALEGRINYFRALQELAKAFSNQLGYETIITYEAFISNKGVRDSLLDNMGVSVPRVEPMEFKQNFLSHV